VSFSGFYDDILILYQYVPKKLEFIIFIFKFSDEILLNYCLEMSTQISLFFLRKLYLICKVYDLQSFLTRIYFQNWLCKCLIPRVMNYDLNIFQYVNLIVCWIKTKYYQKQRFKNNNITHFQYYFMLKLETTLI